MFRHASGKKVFNNSLVNCIYKGPPSQDNGRGGVRSSALECIMGCKIDTSKQVIPLHCLHFICSDNCAAKLKTGSKPGRLHK